MSSNRPSAPGLALALPLVPATGTATECDRLVGTPSSLSDHPGTPSDASISTPIHPSLRALARLLARQISRSEGGDG